MIFSLKNISLSLLSLLVISGCAVDSTESTSSTQAPENNNLCKENVPFDIKLRDGSGASANSLDALELTDQFSQTLYAAHFDECGKYLSDASVSSWSISDSNFVSISESDTSKVVLKAVRGATPIPTTTELSAQATGVTKNFPVNVKWTISSTADLFRWYRADSYLPALDGGAVGSSILTGLTDFSGDENAFTGVVTATGREPRLRLTAFSRPVLQLCGVSSNCSDITMNSHLRIASSYAAFANTDLTFIFVIARANNNTQFLLTNQSAGNNTGAFLGIINGTQFRFGLSGPGGNPQLNVAIPAYDGNPKLEIWTARLDTDASSVNFGMQVYRNGAVLGSFTNNIQQQATATTIPLIGTQRNENNNSNFYFAEMATYKRALSESELCKIHQFLSDKYELGLNLMCAP